jgi:hypothetical protein
MKTFKYSPMRNFCDKFFWSISVIFDQTDDGFTSFEFKGSNGMVAIWIGIWYFFAIILGIVYKGSLYSYMTSSLPPAVPKTLETAVDSGWPIMSTAIAIATTLDKKN